jgi:hypothetical protein
MHHMCSSADPDLLHLQSMPDNATVEPLHPRRVRACAEQLALFAAQAAQHGASEGLLHDAHSICTAAVTTRQQQHTLPLLPLHNGCVRQAVKKQSTASLTH